MRKSMIVVLPLVLLISVFADGLPMLNAPIQIKSTSTRGLCLNAISSHQGALKHACTISIAIQTINRVSI